MAFPYVCFSRSRCARGATPKGGGIFPVATTFVVLYLDHKTGHTGAQSKPRPIRTRLEAPMLFPTTIAGSLPKPEWLAEPNTLWAPWKSRGDELARAKRDATVLAVKLQEDAGVDIVTEGEQARQHFVHGFLEKVGGVDFSHKSGR